MTLKKISSKACTSLLHGYNELHTSYCLGKTTKILKYIVSSD